MKEYVHRAGRLAQAGQAGHALLFLLPSKRQYVEVLELRSLRDISLVAIPISKPTIGNESRKDIIIAVIIKDVTVATFTDATISEHFTPGSIELNLNTRCSSTSKRLSKMEFCWTAEVGEFSRSSSSLDYASFTFCAIALNIRERVAMQCDLSPPFKVFDT
jgi:superfamily II DNA/RNA helicase